MKKLIAVRHGHYSGEHLSDLGKEQMATITDLLRPILQDGPTVIMSSTATRAKESAEIIAAGLGIEFSEHAVLWSDKNHPEDIPAVIKLIRSVDGKADNVVLVSHLEYCEDLPLDYGLEAFGKNLGYIQISKGEAWVIDCESKSLARV